MSFEESLRRALDTRRETHSYRQRRIVRPIDAVHIEIDGRHCVNFASNNYLGLTHHPRIISAMTSATEKNGAGSGAAALVSGYSPSHRAAEEAIAAWKSTQAAVLVGSGYIANLAALQTLTAVAGENLRFLFDKLSHASLIDAVRGSAIPFRVFPHNDMEKLQRLLEKSPPAQLQVVITESIFSMDGDSADLRALARLKQSHPFLLLLDEAHGSGVYGPNGAGFAASIGQQNIVDISIVTLSKALGVYGGAICASRDFCDAVVNFGRSYIFATNLPPAVPAAVETAIDILKTEPQRQQRLQQLTAQTRARLRDARFTFPDGDSPIIPIITGDAETALQMADELLKEGLFVAPIRPPTVAPGKSRLRVTLSSEHRNDEIDHLITALAALSRPTC